MLVMSERKGYSMTNGSNYEQEDASGSDVMAAFQALSDHRKGTAVSSHAQRQDAMSMSIPTQMLSGHHHQPRQFGGERQGYATSSGGIAYPHGSQAHGQQQQQNTFARPLVPRPSASPARTSASAPRTRDVKFIFDGPSSFSGSKRKRRSKSVFNPRKDVLLERDFDMDESSGKFCKVCGIRETSQWRRGPDGETSLCNACGLHFLKIVQREREMVYPPVRSKISVDQLVNMDGETCDPMDATEGPKLRRSR